jgi:hypothetical protein
MRITRKRIKRAKGKGYKGLKKRLRLARADVMRFYESKGYEVRIRRKPRSIKLIKIR